MRATFLFGVVLAMFLVLSQHRVVETKKVIIHVPYRVKKVEHTHTIYKIVPRYTSEHLERHEHHDRREKEEEPEDEDKYDV
nr:uncharacterized protein LOC117221508 [Megalopta genalis]